MQTFTLTLYGASISDVQRLLTEAGLTGLSFAVTWDAEPDDDDDLDPVTDHLMAVTGAYDDAAASPPPTDNVGSYIDDLARAKHNHPSGGGF